MFENLHTTVAEAGEDDLLSSFGDADADKDKGGKKKTDTADKGGKLKKTTSDSGKTGLETPSKTITDFSDDDDNAFATDDDDEEEATAGKKKVKTGKDTKAEEEEEEEEPTEEDPEEETTEEEEEEENKGGDDEDEIKGFLKARADFLIKNGEWADFEGSDKFDWTEDSFAEMELEQRNFQKTQMREELLDSFGPYGKEIADYVSKGGDPDQLIDIFKEQQRVEALNIDTEDAQKAVVLKYETEFLNKKPERVKRYIDSLIADKELAEVAKEAKEAMEASLKDQSDSLQAEQDAIIARNKQKQNESIQNFQRDITSEINKITDISADEKKQLLTVLTKFDKKLKNGTPVNDFYFKFDQFRKDIPNYVKLVRFVLNPEKYEKSIENKGKNTATDKAFRLAKGVNTGKKVKETAPRNREEAPRTKFKLL